MDNNTQSHHLDPFQMVKRIVLAAVCIFLGGYVVTLIAQEAVGYKDLPNKGRVTVTQDGDKRFHPYYPFFRGYVVKSQDDPQPIDQKISKFTQVGIFGRGLFFYGVVNAPHWILEMSFQNLRMITFIPFLALLVGCTVLYVFFLPRAYWSKGAMLQTSIGIGVLHACLVVTALVVFSLFSSTFHSMFGSPHFYHGELTGSFLPGLVIILFTGLFYGAIVGWMLYPVASLVNGLRKDSDSKPGEQTAAA